MARLSRIFLSGLAALVPIVATVALLYWLAASAEAFLGRGIRLVLPADAYLPGMGLAAGALLVFALGLLLDAWIFRRVWSLGEWLFSRIPVVKTVYNAIRDFTDYFRAGERGAGQNQPVAVRLGDGVTLLGLVTRQDLSDLPGPLGEADRIAVYLPMSYQIGGYTLMLPRDAVEPVDMSMDEALRFILTGGISRGRGQPRAAGAVREERG